MMAVHETCVTTIDVPWSLFGIKHEFGDFAIGALQSPKRVETATS